MACEWGNERAAVAPRLTDKLTDFCYWCATETGPTAWIFWYGPDSAPDLSCPYGFRPTTRTVATRLRIRRLGVRVPPSALTRNYATEDESVFAVLAPLPGRSH